MKKNVWIINHYAGSMLFEKGGRHYWFAENLKRQGYSTTIFACNNKHSPGTETFFDTDALWVEHVDKEIGVPFVYILARPYTGNGIYRLLNMIDFYFNVKKTADQYVVDHEKPDIILASSAHPLSLIAGIQIARKYGIKCICEIRDLWPESFIDYGVLKPNSLLIPILRKMEKWIYMRADALVFTMEGAYDYIIERGWEKEVSAAKVNYINNGIDLRAYDFNRDHFQISDSDLENSDIFKVIYTGAIRKVNNLGKLLTVAKLIQNKHITFLIWGQGEELDELKQRLVDEKITNVIFKGGVEKKYVPYITSKADVNIAHNSASALFRFGISFNKIFDYFAAAKPIICDFPCRYNPVISENAGFAVESGKEEDIAKEIDRISEATDLDEFSQNARKAAEKYDFFMLTNKLIRIIEAL